jgi:hypothetical protein
MTMETHEEGARQMLRHAVATVAYRGAKTLRDAPARFANFRIAPSTRTPVEILAHIGDLFDWACGLANGVHEWHDSEPLAWDAEIARFHLSLEKFDARLASAVPLERSAESLFQGPVADALTHVGQLAMLRRLAGANMKGENYFRAEIVRGRVGAEQTPPAREFD